MSISKEIRQIVDALSNKDELPRAVVFDVLEQALRTICMAFR